MSTTNEIDKESGNEQDQIREIARAFYGSVDAVEKLWSEVNNVYAVALGEGLPQKIIKIAKAPPGDEIIREQQIIGSLCRMGLAVPKIEFTQEDYPTVAVPFTVMPRLSLRNMGELYHGSHNSVNAVFKRAGQFLARLAKIPIGHVDGAIPCDEAERRARLHWQRLSRKTQEHGLPSSRPVTEILQTSKRLLDRRMDSFVNGDFHPGNVISDGEAVFYVVDWGNAGAGFLVRDLGRCLAVTKTWYGDSNMILDGFLGVCPLAQEAREELELWESYFLLEFAIGFQSSGEAGRAAELLTQISMGPGVTTTGAEQGVAQRRGRPRA